MATNTRQPAGPAGPANIVPILLRLYPAAWRARYGDEFAELLTARPPSLRDHVDIVIGAVDARVNPHVDGRPDREVRLPGDRAIRGLAIAAGALLTVWGLIGASIMRPWNSGIWPYEPELSTAAWLAGMAGAIIASLALLLLAWRHDGVLGSAGAVGALLLGSGLVFASFGGGLLALAMLGVGTSLLAWRLRGRMLDTLPTLLLTGATAVLIAGFLAFVAGDGQDVRILWALVGYGPAWLLFGFTLRAPAPQLVGA